MELTKGNLTNLSYFQKKVRQTYWWKSNIMGSVAPILRPNPSIVLNIDAYLAGWDASMVESKAGGLFSSEETQQLVNILELKAAYLD